MKTFHWSHEKNAQLMAERDISFEAIVLAIEQGGLVDILAHHNDERYPGQRILVVVLGGYAYLVPFVESHDEYFLKTIIPSRKATREYVKGDADEKGTNR